MTVLSWSTTSTFTGRRWIWLRQQCKSNRKFILSFRFKESYIWKLIIVYSIRKLINMCIV